MLRELGARPGRVRVYGEMVDLLWVEGMAAADLNNQLHALQGFARFLARDPGLSEADREDLAQVTTKKVG